MKKLEVPILLILMALSPFYLEFLWKNLSWIANDGARFTILVCILCTFGFGYASHRMDK